ADGDRVGHRAAVGGQLLHVGRLRDGQPGQVVLLKATGFPGLRVVTGLVPRVADRYLGRRLVRRRRVLRRPGDVAHLAVTAGDQGDRVGQGDRLTGGQRPGPAQERGVHEGRRIAAVGADVVVVGGVVEHP